MVDNDIIRYILEGQDMVVDIHEGLSPSSSGSSGYISTLVEIKLTF